MTHAQKVYIYEALKHVLGIERSWSSIVALIGTHGLEHLEMGLIELKKEIDSKK